MREVRRCRLRRKRCQCCGRRGAYGRCWGGEKVAGEERGMLEGWKEERENGINLYFNPL
jgi:hypothetical protein